MILILKKLKRDTTEWEKNLTRANELQKEIAEKCEVAVSLMLDYLSGDVQEKIGSSYDDVLEYYNNYIDNLE
jgi:abortive infection bacteriophage resistance protein